jgi:gliding motility associated protien GldN
MKRTVFSFVIIAIIISLAPSKSADAQFVNGAFKRQDVLPKKPMPIPMVREADVLWSQMVWRIIDVREKINLPLFYPTVQVDSMDWIKPEVIKSFISILLKGVENQSITAYDARTDDDFKSMLTYEEVKKAFGAEAKTIEVQNFDTGEMETRNLPAEIRKEEIKQFMIKEEWYFDKANSRLQVRIIGICPIQEFTRDDVENSPVQRRKVFWVYYPEARPWLAMNQVFNPNNDARRMSFDDLLIKRYFNSYIVQESNVYNNRAINSYLEGKEAMLESKRIEDRIFNLEQDLWEY